MRWACSFDSSLFCIHVLRLTQNTITFLTHFTRSLNRVSTCTWKKLLAMTFPPPAEHVTFAYKTINILEAVCYLISQDPATLWSQWERFTHLLNIVLFPSQVFAKFRNIAYFLMA